jgi:hypothetical protein
VNGKSDSEIFRDFMVICMCEDFIEHDSVGQPSEAAFSTLS